VSFFLNGKINDIHEPCRCTDSPSWRRGLQCRYRMAAGKLRRDLGYIVAWHCACPCPSHFRKVAGEVVKSPYRDAYRRCAAHTYGRTSAYTQAASAHTRAYGTGTHAPALAGDAS